MYFVDGKVLITIMMGLIVAKFVWVFYTVGKSLSEYRWENDLDWGDFDPAERAAIQEKWRAQKKLDPTQKVKQVLIGELSRFSSELHFFRSCTTPYAILGCDSYATLPQIKKRYRILVQKWHPDRVKGLGATDKEVAQATEILQIINEAYNTLNVSKAA